MFPQLKHLSSSVSNRISPRRTPRLCRAMADKRKAEEMITWWEYDFLHIMPYKFRRLLTWNPAINDAEEERLPLPIDPVQDVVPLDNQRLENQPAEDVQEMEMD